MSGMIIDVCCEFGSGNETIQRLQTFYWIKFYKSMNS